MSQKLEEKSLSREVQAASIRSQTAAPPLTLSDLDQRIRRTLHAASEKKAIDPTVLDLRDIAGFTDFFIIFSGANRRQVQAIADGIVEQLKRERSPASRVEGYQTAEWVLIDYGDFVVHIFDDKARHFYDLERLWREARRLDVSPEQIESQLVNLKPETVL